MSANAGPARWMTGDGALAVAIAAGTVMATRGCGLGALAVVTAGGAWMTTSLPSRISPGIVAEALVVTTREGRAAIRTPRRALALLRV
jgi:hypothetical protein